MAERTDIPKKARHAILREAGYCCAVPTCGTTLAIDLHHIWEVKDGGGNELSNLIALCPTHHALYHRGFISSESIAEWKRRLVAINEVGSDTIHKIVSELL
ncbi:MAG: HNH endonuclease signature motif containing protein, partial [Prosthecobacter sp.]